MNFKLLLKKKLISLLGLACSLSLSGAPINEQTATEVAENFCKTIFAENLLKTTNTVNLVYICNPSENNSLKSTENNTLFYVFNHEDDGFVIVSGDDAVVPILGYSNEDTFDPQGIPPVVSGWLDGYKQQIEYARNSEYSPAYTLKSDWQQLKLGISKQKSASSSVTPLLQTKWGQNPYVNEYCPFDADSLQYTVAGCVATAMAQIMKFYNYPQQGYEWYSYNHHKYGTLSANFGRTNYNWSAMPDSIAIFNHDVALLMYHCGVSVEMSYGVSKSGGSSAYILSSKSPTQNCAEYAFKSYFGYSSAIKGVERRNYSDADWTNLIKSELNAGRPVQYAGYGQGGHTFVCDGYDANNYFHMNWGWRGKFNGNYILDALSPVNPSNTSGPYTFNLGQQALIGIEPDYTISAYQLEIVEDVATSQDTIKYGKGFSITTNIKNFGSNDFSGDYCAAAYDKKGAFVDFIEIKTGMELKAGSTHPQTITFTNTGTFSLLPGRYSIYIYFRGQNGKWRDIKSFSNIVDSTLLYITNTNDIRLYKPITTTPSKDIYGNMSLSISTDIANYSDDTFTGSFKATLYNIDGTFVANIQQKTGMTLNANKHYTNGVSFYTSDLNVDPGTYLLAISHKYDTGKWTLTGSSALNINPIEIMVKESPLNLDIYEKNNTQETAHQMNVIFLNDIATVTTLGSNIHIGNDEDFYYINLESGYSYKVKAKLYDLFNNNPTNLYTVDAITQYSVNNDTWSRAYDNSIDEDITINGHNKLCFWVGPYFTGSTGNYKLETTITRAPLQNAVSLIGCNPELKIYPNPASNLVYIDQKYGDDTKLGILITDLSGKAFLEGQYYGGGIKTIDISALNDGLYILNITNSEGTREIRKLMVRK